MLVPNVTEYNLGDVFVISANVGDYTTYGIQWCDITLKCTTNYGKPSWDFQFTQDFYDFMYEHFWEVGISWNKFDMMVKDKVGLRCWSENFIRKYDDKKYQDLQERRLELHHQKVLNFQDFELNDIQKNQNEIKLAEIMYRNRLGVLARLDKRHRDKLEIEGNVSDSLAKIIIARKNKETEE